MVMYQREARDYFSGVWGEKLCWPSRSGDLAVRIHVSLGWRPYCLDGVFTILSSYQLMILPV